MTMSRRCFFIGVALRDNPVAYHFSALARQLAARGHNVVLITPHRMLELENHQGNPATYTWPSERSVHLRDALFLWTLIRRHHPDCMVANFCAVNLMVCVGWLARVPVRVAWHHTATAAIDMDDTGPLWIRKLLRFRKSVVLRLATHVVAVSKAMVVDLEKVFHVPKSKSLVFYNSLDGREFHPEPHKDDMPGKKLVCVGRFARCKGQDVLIRALGILCATEAGVSIDFVGEGPQEQGCRRLANVLGVGARCNFLGKRLHDEAVRQIAGAAVSVIPSRSEGLPLVAIESLAVGTPVVASEVGGLPEIIREGLEGFLVPPDNPEVLASKLKLLLTDAALRRRIGLQGRERFLSTFEQGKIVEQQVNWLESIT
jgi:glycosyltransferase involved in cell wall biosynthesis